MGPQSYIRRLVACGSNKRNEKEKKEKGKKKNKQGKLTDKLDWRVEKKTPGDLYLKRSLGSSATFDETGRTVSMVASGGSWPHCS